MEGSETQGPIKVIMIGFNDYVGETEMTRKEFTEEKKQADKAVNTYPLSRDIPRDLTPDWVLYITFALLAVTAWLRVSFSNFISATFSALVNYQIAVQLYDENNLIRKRISFILHLIYFLSTGLYLFLLCNHFHWYPLGLQGINLFFSLSAFLAGMVFFRIFIMNFIGFLFVRQELFSRFLYHFFLTNKVLGLVLLPFIIAIAYSEGVFNQIMVYSSMLVITSAYLLRLIRSVLFIFKNVFLLFYLILYLCAVELLPFLVIIKLILSLA